MDAKGRPGHRMRSTERNAHARRIATPAISPLAPMGIASGGQRGAKGQPGSPASGELAPPAIALAAQSIAGGCKSEDGPRPDRPFTQAGTYAPACPWQRRV